MACPSAGPIVQAHGGASGRRATTTAALTMHIELPCEENGSPRREALVCVVDDDAAVVAPVPSDPLGRARCHRLPVRAGVLDHPPHDGPACVLLDVRMPGLGGLDLQARPRKRKQTLPIIFITARQRAHERARHEDAWPPVDFLQKPFNDDECSPRQRALAMSRHGAPTAPSARRSSAPEHPDAARAASLRAVVRGC